jgi:hypothetical protein
MAFPGGTNACVAGGSCGADAGACTTCGLLGLPCCANEGCVEGVCSAGQCYMNTMQ